MKLSIQLSNLILKSMNSPLKTSNLISQFINKITLFTIESLLISQLLIQVIDLTLKSSNLIRKMVIFILKSFDIVLEVSDFVSELIILVLEFGISIGESFKSGFVLFDLGEGSGEICFESGVLVLKGIVFVL